jgi:hypothetical protein
MTRLPRLYAILSGLVAASTIACGPCPDPDERTVVVDPTAMALQESFERCQIDDLDCADLCSAVYELMNGKDSAEYVSFSACELIDLDGQPAVHYTVNYECFGGRLPPGAMLKDDKCATTET